MNRIKETLGNPLLSVSTCCHPAIRPVFCTTGAGLPQLTTFFSMSVQLDLNWFPIQYILGRNHSNWDLYVLYYLQCFKLAVFTERIILWRPCPNKTKYFIFCYSDATIWYSSMTTLFPVIPIKIIKYCLIIKSYKASYTYECTRPYCTFSVVVG